MTKLAEIRKATIHNCIIGNAVYIGENRSCIINYTIEEEAIIKNADLLAVEGESSLGNGTEVVVVNKVEAQKNTESMMACRLTRLKSSCP